MRNWKNNILTITITLNCMLVFFLLVESRLVVPGWLQIAGRLHTVLLHFPIVCVIGYALIAVIARKTGKEILSTLLLLSALAAVVTCIMGLLLSKEEGYDASALQWHKWAGTALSVLLILSYYLYNKLDQKRWLQVMSALVLFGIVVFTGHEGGNITHGEDFLLAPLQSKEQNIPQVAFEEANVFTHLIQPILTTKCVTCHSKSKAKGDLILETADMFKKGGKNGVLWDTASGDLGLLLRRIHLPIDDKKHMAPSGKPQLTAEEIELIELWIQKGADFNLMAAQLPAQDPLRRKAESILKSSENEVYDFAAADNSTIAKLNTENRVVSEKSLHSPALNAMFFNSQLFNSQQLAELSAIKKQLVSLSLAYMPVTDNDLTVIGSFENLRHLNLSFTKIKGNGLNQLKKLNRLQTISLSGTPVTVENMQALAGLPKLKRVQVWETGITDTMLAGLEKKYNKIKFNIGYNNDTATLKLSPPVFRNETEFFADTLPIQLKHYINGVDIHYTVDGKEPDSLSPVYKGNLTLNSVAQVKAKAYKKGWHSSDAVIQSFLKSSITPDSIYFLLQPEKQYNNLPGILVDKQKGSLNYGDGSWVAWRSTQMSVVLQFNTPVQISTIGIDNVVNTNSYIMPPKKLEVWGGMELNNLKLIGTKIPIQPTRNEPAFPSVYEIKVAARNYKYIKIIGTPVNPLPGWHPGKGDKGWIFTDEILIN